MLIKLEGELEQKQSGAYRFIKPVRDWNASGNSPLKLLALTDL